MNEWTKWEGSDEAPVATNALVEVQLRDGGTLLMHASVLDWVHDQHFPESDIVQFRVVDAPAAKRSPMF